MPTQTLLLLHGALGDKSQFTPLIPLLAPHWDVHVLDFAGHGVAPLTQEWFSIEHFADNLLAYLDTQSLSQAHLFGYSMGGYVGLYAAAQHPERIASVFTLATKFAWTPEIAERETRQLDADRIAIKVPAFAQALEARHPALGWRTVLQQTRTLLEGLGAAPIITSDLLASLAQPVRVALGDRDTMVTLDETIVAYRTLRAGELQIFPGTPHPFERVSPTRLAAAITDFFSGTGQEA